MSRFQRQRGASFTLWASFISKRSPSSADCDANRVGDTHIWIGSLNSGMNEEFLEAENVRYTLTVARGMVEISSTSSGKESPSPITRTPSDSSNPTNWQAASDIERAVLPLKDDASEILVSPEDDSLLRALEFMDEALERKSNVLVHCEQGISRSTAVVCAYLITRKCMSLEEALALIRQTRPQVRPNIGFALQLKKLAETKDAASTS